MNRKKKLNEDITPSELMILHKYYDERIERNEKIIKLFSKIKFDDKEELFTYESSSKLSVPEQFKNLQDKYTIFDKVLSYALSAHRHALESFEKGDARQLEKDIDLLDKVIAKIEWINGAWKKNDKESKKKFFTKRKSQTAAKHIVNVCNNLKNINKSLKYDRDTYYDFLNNFDKLFPKSFKDVPNARIRDAITKSFNNIRMDLVRMSQDEGNFIIKAAKKKGLEFK